MQPTPVSTTKDDAVGRIVTPVVIENYADVENAAAGLIPPEAIRRVEVPDALVDTGASALSLAPSLIEGLGLRPIGQRNARTTVGVLPVTVYSAVRLSIQDRDSVVKVAEVPEGSPVLIGQLPLEEMDLVLSPAQGTLIPNPAHGGEWMIELY